MQARLYRTVISPDHYLKEMVPHKSIQLEPENVLEVLSFPPIAQQMFIITESQGLYFEWNIKLKNGFAKRGQFHGFYMRNFKINFPYTGSLFLVQNYRNMYAFLLDSKGVVIYFYIHKPDLPNTIAISQGKSIAPGYNTINIGAVALDWYQDILVFYNQDNHCIESVKLNKLGKVYTLACLSPKCPSVVNMAVNVKKQEVIYHTNQQVQFISLVGYNTVPLRCPAVKKNEIQSQQFLLDYEPKKEVLSLFNADQGEFKKMSFETIRPSAHVQFKLHNLFRGTKFFMSTKNLAFWYQPNTRKAYFYNTHCKSSFNSKH